MSSDSSVETATRIVDADPAHLPAIAEIYASVVRSSPATFDIEPPSLESWREALADADPAAGHFLLVALDAGDQVLGYATSGTYMVRAAYDTTCQTSIYVAERARGGGVGKALYSELFERLDRSALRLAVAGIAQPNPASTALHRAFGFEPVGTFSGVGVKFDRAWDVTWHQRALGRGRD